MARPSGRSRSGSRSIRSVLALPRVPAVAVASLAARLPKGMLPLGVVLLLHAATGSYAAGGLTVALMALGDAATAPLQARLVDRHGRARVLLPVAAVHVLAVGALLALVRIAAPVPALAVAAALAGVGIPPVSGSVKALWARLVPADRRVAAYALESLLQQVVFLTGPLAVGGLVALSGPVATVTVAALLVVGGTVAYVVAAAPVPETRRPARPRGAGHRGGNRVLHIPAVRILVAGSLLQGLTFGAVPVGVAASAAAAGHPDAAGLIQAGLTTGGLLGSFLPARPAAPGRYVRLVAGQAVAFGLVLPCAAVTTAAGAPLLAAALVGAGLFLTPVAATCYVLTENAAPAASHTEAFAWLSTGLAIGTSAGAALAGPFADHGGAVLALAVAPAGIGLAAALLGGTLGRDRPRGGRRVD